MSLHNGYSTSRVGFYFLYGHIIRSAWPLPNITIPEGEANSVDFEFFSDDNSFISNEIKEILSKLDDTIWFHHARLLDGSDYIRWKGLFDFIISTDGRKIIGRSLSDNPREAFQAYLLGQVLSFALVRQGVEPLHSTVVVKNGQAVAFLGNCGYGKSTLAGGLLQAGFQILTDDMLIIKEKDGEFLAYPGPPRIKLFPEIAKELLGGEVVGTPMNPGTPKLVLPLPTKNVVQTPMALKTFYVLQPPDAYTRKVTINQLSRSQAFLEFIQNTFNTILRSSERLTQQFRFASELAANLPVKSLSYPRELARLHKVVDVVLSDIA